MSEVKKVDLSSEVLTLDEVGARWFRIALIVAVVGLAASVLLGPFAADGWRQYLHSWLANFLFFTSISLGALFFTLIQHLTRAGWSVAVRRLAEATAKNLLWPLPLFLIPIVGGIAQLYPWADHQAAAADPLIHSKAAFLNLPFFVVRTVVYFGVWGWLSHWFLARSTEQDQTGDPALTQRMERLAAPGMLLFALTLTFFAFDYTMSLKPQWYSTMFGVYFFSGSLVAYFAFQPIVARLIQNAGRLRGIVSAEHYHDMGKLVFAFLVFWAYIGFSQYMLMWYANLPEETVWYGTRTNPAWANVSWTLLFGHFFAPFLFLMSRHMKRRTVILMLGAGWMLCMHWLDIYWLVMPGAYPQRVPLSLIDLALFLGLGGLWAAFGVRRLGRHALVPLRDPRLAESLRFENI